MKQTAARALSAGEWIAEALIYAISLAPLIVTSQSSIFPFVFGKAVFLQAAIGLLAIVMIPLFAKHPEYRPRRSLFLIAMGVYALTLLASAATAFDPARALWSNFERMTGVVFLWHMLVYAVVVASYFVARPQRLIPFLTYHISVTAVVSLAGLYQLINTSFLFASSNRVAGTFGNPIYLGGYAAQSFLIALYLAYHYRGRAVQWLMCAIAVIHLLAVYYSGTRSAFVGLLAAVGVAALLITPRLWRAGYKAYVLGAVFGVVALAITLVGLVRMGVIAQDSMAARFVNISSSVNTASTRFIAWEIAFKGFKDRPLLGWGPENYYYVFNTHFNPRSQLFGTGETWFDHAHNAPLDVLVTQGAIGFLAYLFQYVVIFWMCWKTPAETREARLLSLSLALFFVVHFVHNIFVFDHPGSYAMFYLFAGVVAARYWAALPVPAEGRRMPVGAIVVSQVVLLAAAWYVIIPTVRQNNLDFKAQLYAQMKNLPQSQAYFARARDVMWPHYTPDVLLDAGRTLQRAVPVDRLKDEAVFVTFVMNGLDELVTRYQPHNVLAYLLQGQVYTSLVQAGDASAIAKAEKAFTRALEISPDRQQIYFSHARMKMLLNDNEGGKAILRKAIAIDPAVPISHWYYAIFVYGFDKKDALSALKTALELGFDPDVENNYLLAAAIFEQNGDYGNAAHWLMQGITQNRIKNWNPELLRQVVDVAIKAQHQELLARLRSMFPGAFDDKGVLKI